MFRWTHGRLAHAEWPDARMGDGSIVTWPACPLWPTDAWPIVQCPYGRMAAWPHGRMADGWMGDGRMAVWPMAAWPMAAWPFGAAIYGCSCVVGWSMADGRVVFFYFFHFCFFFKLYIYIF